MSHPSFAQLFFSLQIGVAEAIAALSRHLPAVLEEYGPLASGVVRLEAPIARGCTALQWLAGQEAVVDSLDEVWG